MEGSSHQQEISVWEWTAERDGPVCACAMPTPDLQTSVRVNLHDARQLVTNGQDRVVFWSWEEGKVGHCILASAVLMNCGHVLVMVMVMEVVVMMMMNDDGGGCDDDDDE